MQLRESQLREQILKRQLDRQCELTKAERKRARREATTAAMRGKQAERRNGKAAARKRKQARRSAASKAANKNSERARNGKRPAGEPLHTGELKHRRLCDERGQHSGCNNRGNGRIDDQSGRR